jgi:hypothetical protein
MLQLVPQIHNTGCFIACIATLLEISYQEAFERIHKKPCPPPDAYFRQHLVGLTPEQSLEVMPSLGLKMEKSNLRNVRSLRRRTSLILLRWQDEPTQMHGIVFDGEARKFLDPDPMYPVSLRRMQKNLEAIYHVRRLTKQ